MHDSDDRSPKDRPLEPEHPMSLEGGFVEGDPAFMLQCLAEDYLQAGTDVEQLMRMSRDPFYQAIFAARRAIGNERADAVLAGAVAKSQGLNITVWESASQDAPVDLVISARTKSQE